MPEPAVDPAATYCCECRAVTFRMLFAVHSSLLVNLTEHVGDRAIPAAGQRKTSLASRYMLQDDGEALILFHPSSS
jgi:hypothetical protein